MIKMLTSNLLIKTLAVMAAVIFWFLIVVTENTFYTFPEQVPVKAFNVPENLVVAGDLGSVTLRLKIDNRDVIKNLTADNFNAYVDLEGATVGEKEIEIEVSSKKSDINVVKIEPGKITVAIEEKSEKEVPIEYDVQTEPKDGYFVKEVDISEDKVIIKGPEKVLSEITHATLILNLDNLTDDYKSSFSVKVLDKEGNPIEGVTPIKESIEANVIIGAVSDQKIAGIQPTIVGTPQDNIWIKSITVDPSFVVLSGERSVLDSISYVKTSDIDVTGITDDLSFNVNITGLPDGVIIENSDNIKVNITVEKYNAVESSLKRKTASIPVIVKKFTTDQHGIQINPATVTLVTEGDPDLLDKLDPKLKAEIDISGYEGKTAKVNISEENLNLPTGVHVVSITPSSVDISWD